MRLSVFFILICRAFSSFALKDITLRNTYDQRNTTQDLKKEAKAITSRRDEISKFRKNAK
jgi:hypothetical protein